MQWLNSNIIGLLWKPLFSLFVCLRRCSEWKIEIKKILCRIKKEKYIKKTQYLSWHRISVTVPKYFLYFCILLLWEHILYSMIFFIIQLCWNFCSIYKNMLSMFFFVVFCSILHFFLLNYWKLHCFTFYFQSSALFCCSIENSIVDSEIYFVVPNRILRHFYYWVCQFGWFP